MANTINLLAPSTVIRKRNASESYGKLLAAGCFFAVLLTSAIYAGFYVLNSQLSTELDSVNVEVKALGQAASQAIETESVRARFNETVSDVDRLKAQRPVFSLYLDELLKITPVDVEITHIELVNNPFEATVKGAVNSQAAVAQFGRNLQRSRLFKESIVIYSEKRAEDKAVTFVMSVTPAKKGEQQ